MDKVKFVGYSLLKNLTLYAHGLPKQTTLVQNV